MKIEIGKPGDNIQSIWKETEESHCATFHGYGFFDYKDTDTPELIKRIVMHDLKVKLSIMSSESILPVEGLFNYDRFYNRFGVECLISIFQDYEEIGDFDYKEFAEFHDILKEGKFERFFGGGEFPFVHYGLITRQNGDRYIVYFLCR